MFSPSASCSCPLSVDLDEHGDGPWSSLLHRCSWNSAVLESVSGSGESAALVGDASSETPNGVSTERLASAETLA